MKTTKTTKTLNETIADIVSVYGCSEQQVLRLMEITSDMSKGAKFARIIEYSSDKSDHSELADHTIILNFSYENMRKDDKQTLRTFDVNVVDVNKFNYDSIDTKGMELTAYKNEVRNCLNNALYEINNPKKKETSNDYYLNDMLVFNHNTLRLSIIGQGVKKEIIVEGEYKKVKSAPLTIAKKLIKKQANLRVEKYKRFTIDNLSIINLQGETLEIQ
jgi:hypothetical protein